MIMLAVIVYSGYHGSSLGLAKKAWSLNMKIHSESDLKV